MVKVIDVDMSMFACLYRIMGCPSIVSPPLVSYKALGHSRLVVCCYNCIHLPM